MANILLSGDSNFGTGDILSDVIFSLDKLKNDKNDKVRNVSAKALQIWNKLEDKYNKAYLNAEKEKGEEIPNLNIAINENRSKSPVAKDPKSPNNYSKLKMLRDLNKISKSKEKKIHNYYLEEDQG